jgi:hypothetical protein
MPGVCEGVALRRRLVGLVPIPPSRQLVACTITFILD